jgi:hypothetical protein
MRDGRRHLHEREHGANPSQMGRERAMEGTRLSWDSCSTQCQNWCCVTRVRWSEEGVKNVIPHLVK